MRRLLLLLWLALFLVVPGWTQVPEKLKRQVQSLISQADVGRCSVALVHLPSGQRVEIEALEAYPLASVFKVPVMIELVRQIQERQSALTLSSLLKLSASDLCIGSGNLQHKPVGSRYSVQQLVEWMETKSDNTATDMLFRHIGLESVDRFLRTLGCSSSQIFLTNRAAWLISLGQSSDFKGLSPQQIAARWNKLSPEQRLQAARRAEQENLNLSLSQFQRLEDRSASRNTPSQDRIVACAVDNKASAHDLALLLEKLYAGQLLQSRWTDYCLGVLARQSYNTRIPRYLPAEVEVYHKTGTIAGVVNDIGLVELGNGQALVVVALIQGVEEGRQDLAEALIGRIAQVAYRTYATKSNSS